MTKKYPKVLKSTDKLGGHSFFTGGTTKVAKNTQTDQKVPKSTQK